MIFFACVLQERALAQREQELLAALNKGPPAQSPSLAATCLQQARISPARGAESSRDLGQTLAPRAPKQNQVSSLKSFEVRDVRSSPPLQPISSPVISKVSIENKSKASTGGSRPIEVFSYIYRVFVTPLCLCLFMFYIYRAKVMILPGI